MGSDDDSDDETEGGEKDESKQKRNKFLDKFLPPISRLSDNLLIQSERDYYSNSSSGGGGGGGTGDINQNYTSTATHDSYTSTTANRRHITLDFLKKESEPGVVLPFLRPFAPSRLALDCFAQPQPRKYGYGPSTLAAVVKLSGEHNPLFADQVLHAFAHADRLKKEKLTFGDVV